MNESSAKDIDVAFACRAVDMQLREDFCPRWPMLDYSPVQLFRNTKNLPVASSIAILFSIVDKFDGLSGQSAYHSFAGVPFARIGNGLGELSVLLSHEVIEYVVNPTCLATFVMADGSVAAREAADPIQSWTYEKQVSVLGEPRSVPVSAFVLPSYFGGNGAPCVYAPGFAAETVLPGTIAPGGYLPVRGKAGWEPRFGMGADRNLIASKALNPTGRAVKREA